MDVIPSQNICASSQSVNTSSTLHNDGFNVQKWLLHMCGRMVHLMDPKFEVIHIMGWWPFTCRKECLKEEMFLYGMLKLVFTPLVSPIQIVDFESLRHIARSQPDIIEKGIVIE
jgi:hypothetical protein